METRRRPVTYLVIGLIAVALIAWLTARAVAKQRLIRALSSNDMSVRVARARELLEAEKLVDALPAQPIIRRSKTAEALGEIGTDEAIRALGVLLEDQEEAPKRWARQALAKIGKPSMPVLMHALAVGGATKDEAVTALKSENLGPSVVPEVRFLLTDRAAYKGAAEALSQMGRPGIGALLEACYAVDIDLRKPALDNLGKQRVRAAIPACLDNLKAGKSSAIGNAIAALGLIGDQSAAPALLRFVASKDDRTGAVTSLGLLRYPGAVEPILATLTETERAYRATAILALHRIGAPAFPGLIRTLQSPQLVLRRGAASALIGSRSSSLNAPLSAALKDPDSEVRASAALSLGWPGNVSAVSALVPALSDPEWRVVDAAAYGLGAIGPSAVPPLLAAVSNPSEDLTTRYQVARALSLMGRPAVPALIAALSRPDAGPEARKWAAVALGQIGDPRAVAPLKTLEKTSTGDLKWQAQEQLRVLAGLTKF